MKRNRRHGDGTAWLAIDRRTSAFLCYWYAGANDAYLVESACVTSASDAVEWGRLRSSRVRIRTGDGLTRWAGTAPMPAGFNHAWSNEVHTEAAA